MKKKIFTLFVTFLCLGGFSGVFAADDCTQSCKIQDGPAPALTEYFTNIDTLIGKISQ